MFVELNTPCIHRRSPGQMMTYTAPNPELLLYFSVTWSESTSKRKTLLLKPNDCSDSICIIPTIASHWLIPNDGIPIHLQRKDVQCKWTKMPTNQITIWEGKTRENNSKRMNPRIFNPRIGHVASITGLDSEKWHVDELPRWEILHLSVHKAERRVRVVWLAESEFF